VLPSERTGIPQLPVTPTEWLPPSERRAFKRLLLNSSIWSCPVAFELVLHSAIVTDFAMARLPESLSCPLLPFMQPNLLQTVASVLRRSSHTDGACFPGKEQEFLSYRPHQRSGGSLPEGPNSFRVTFSRRSPQMQGLGPSNPGAIARETGLELFPSVTCTELQFFRKH
jgi:hypothetical protein